MDSTIDTPTGRELLRAFLAGPPKRTQEWLADALGTSQANVSLWLSGRTRPSDEHREALQILAGIDRDSWRTDEERQVVARAVAWRAAHTGEGDSTRAA